MEKIAARSITVDSNGAVLLGQRSNDNCRSNKGKWEFPGGTQKVVGENWVITAIRETFEETGIQVCPPVDARPYYIHTDSLHGYRRYRTVFYLARAVNTDIRRYDLELDDANWFYVEEAAALPKTEASAAAFERFQTEATDLRRRIGRNTLSG